MSHFLARLVERTRGNSPRVEPIIAPRFATPPPVAEIAAATEASPLVQDEISRLEVPKKNNGEFVRHEDPPAEAREREIIERTIPPAPETLLVPVSPQPTGKAGNRERSTWTRGSGSLRRDVLPHVQSAAAQANARRANHQPRSAISQPAALSNSSFPPPNDNAPNDHPIVRVTIGRIEVRATPAAPPPPRKTSPIAPPLLSLDAYAKAKKEGRR